MTEREGGRCLKNQVKNASMNSCYHFFSSNRDVFITQHKADVAASVTLPAATGLILQAKRLYQALFEIMEKFLGFYGFKKSF